MTRNAVRATSKTYKIDPTSNAFKKFNGENSLKQRKKLIYISG